MASSSEHQKVKSGTPQFRSEGAMEEKINDFTNAVLEGSTTNHDLLLSKNLAETNNPKDIKKPRRGFKRPNHQIHHRDRRMITIPVKKGLDQKGTRRVKSPYSIIHNHRKRQVLSRIKKRLTNSSVSSLERFLCNRTFHTICFLTTSKSWATRASRLEAI